MIVTDMMGQPQYLNGDMVEVRMMYGSGSSEAIPGMVIAVLPENSAPDISIRGMDTMQRWSYWVLAMSHSYYKDRVLGPFTQSCVRLWKD